MHFPAYNSACTDRVFTMPILQRLFRRSFDHRPHFFCSKAGLFFMAWGACQSNTAMHNLLNELFFPYKLIHLAAFVIDLSLSLSVCVCVFLFVSHQFHTIFTC